MRCDAGGASGHVTMKPSICDGSAFYKSSVYAVNVSCLTPGGLPGVGGATEFGETRTDRSAEVSSGHSRWHLTIEGPNNRGNGRR